MIQDEKVGQELVQVYLYFASVLIKAYRESDVGLTDSTFLDGSEQLDICPEFFL